MRQRILVILVLMTAAAAAWTARQILHDGVSARATPTRLEIAAARQVRHLAIPAGARATVNPVPASAEALREGMLHFADHCAACHGNDGNGETDYGRGMFPKPPDMCLGRTQELSDGELFWIIENGVRFTGMPAFSEPGEQEESWKLVRFIRHLPAIRAEEILEMRRGNPKTAEERAEEQEEEKFLRGENPLEKSPGSGHHHH
jgi:mono/diheme cytochrome c family protein